MFTMQAKNKPAALRHITHYLPDIFDKVFSIR
jgi:hypothetical protein